MTVTLNLYPFYEFVLLICHQGPLKDPNGPTRNINLTGSYASLVEAEKSGGGYLRIFANIKTPKLKSQEYLNLKNTKKKIVHKIAEISDVSG